MKTSLQWLRDFLPGPLDPHAAANALTHGGLPVEKFESHGSDTVIDVEVTSNRSDCLSHIGVARELAALLDRQVSIPVPVAPESAAPASSLVSLSLQAPDLCFHYTARILRNLKIGPSPQWMVDRLAAVGLRPVNNVVDVTNYVLFEMGQPLHAFDFDKLTGGQVIVRRANAGEKLVSLDGRERALTPEMLVIADAARPVALAGVMGGRDTEVTEATVNVLLESARFDPLTIRKTARGLAMASDSSYRFERGIDPLLPVRASLRAAQLMLQTAGGELMSGVVEAGSPGHAPRSLTLRLAKLKQVLGIHLPVDEVLAALKRDHLSPELVGNAVRCLVPSYRLDLNLEIDLVEEVARIVGYDAVPSRDEIPIRLTRPDPAAAGMQLIRQILVAAGYFESVTFSFVSDPLAGDFVPHGAAPTAPLLRAEHSVRKADAHLRPSILPGLLESLRHNESSGVEDPRLFEIGATFWNDADGKAIERRRVALAGAGDFAEVRGVVETLLGRLNPNLPVRVEPGACPGFGPGACGRVEWDGKTIGHVGLIDRTIADKLSLRQRPSAAELDLEPLLAGLQQVPQLRPLPRFPAVRRDLSLVVPDATRYASIDALIREQKPQHMEALQYVTTYRGKPLEKGQKSVTVTLVFRSPTETLTSEAVDASVSRIIQAAGAQGWTQRA